MAPSDAAPQNTSQLTVPPGAPSAAAAVPVQLQLQLQLGVQATATAGGCVAIPVHPTATVTQASLTHANVAPAPVTEGAATNFSLPVINLSKISAGAGAGGGAHAAADGGGAVHAAIETTASASGAGKVGISLNAASGGANVPLPKTHTRREMRSGNGGGSLSARYDFEGPNALTQARGGASGASTSRRPRNEYGVQVRVGGNGARTTHMQTHVNAHAATHAGIAGGGASGGGKALAGMPPAAPRRRGAVDASSAAAVLSRPSGAQPSSMSVTSGGAGGGTRRRAGGIRGSGRGGSGGGATSASDTPAMTPAHVLRSHAGALTAFEQSEVLEYPKLWYLGTGAPKVRGMPEVGKNNHGFDDERGDYTLVAHDHLAYRYEVLGKLGKGSFGQVAKCFDHRTGSMCAVKLIRNKKRFHSQALIEVKILERLRGRDADDAKNVVHMHEAFYFRGHLCISFELLSVNLYEFLKNNKFAGLSLGLIRRFAAQLLVSLKFLRKQRVIHCDLKPENILLRHPSRSGIKIIDFGSSCYEDERVYTYIQSRFYRSPEVVLGLPYNVSIDMWSFGCILAELYTGYPLFPGENEAEQLACIMEVMGVPSPALVEASKRRKVFFDSAGEPRPVINSRGRRRRPGGKDLAGALRCSDPLFVDFIAACLRWDSRERLTPEEALEHEWMEGMGAAAARGTPAQTQSHTRGHSHAPATKPLRGSTGAFSGALAGKTGGPAHSKLHRPTSPAGSTSSRRGNIMSVSSRSSNASSRRAGAGLASTRRPHVPSYAQHGHLAHVHARGSGGARSRVIGSSHARRRADKDAHAALAVSEQPNTAPIGAYRSRHRRVAAAGDMGRGIEGPSAYSTGLYSSLGPSALLPPINHHSTRVSRTARWH